MIRSALIAAVLMLGGCASTSGPDACGYTWFREGPPARVVTIRVEPDWRQWPGVCKNIRSWGCTSTHKMPDGTRWAEIRLRDEPAVTGPCAPIVHELLHAAGFGHRETYAFELLAPVPK